MFETIGIFYRGLLLGLVIAAPVGPVGLMCIRRTVHRGLLVGLATGLGAAIADMIFGGIAAFGVTTILDFIHTYEKPIRLLGGVFMLIAAWRTWRDKPRESPKPDHQNEATDEKKTLFSPLWHVFRAAISGCAITLTNPVTLFATLAVVATFSKIEGHHDALTITGGIFAGSALWWCLLSGGVALVRSRFTEARVILMNRITAVALAAFGVWAAGSFLIP